MAKSREPINVADFVGIMRLTNAYADAVIDRDAEAWSACWTDDGVWDLGGGRAIEGRDAIVGLWKGAMSAFATVIQTVHTGEVWCGADDTHATGRWNISEKYLMADGKTGMLLAHYDDEYRRENGRWLYTKRELVPHYQGPADLSGKFL
jgi:ketosteroid isomerase-like protein